MDLRFELLTHEDTLYDRVKDLYEASFPANERRPFPELLGGFRGSGEVYAVCDGDFFVGMISLLSLRDITHILYFAVLPELRDRGFGSGILALLRKDWPGQRIIADVETPEEDAPNNEERNMRIEFYLRNGYEFTEIAYRWEGEDYRVLSNGGNVTGKEFGAFWHYYRP